MISPSSPLESVKKMRQGCVYDANVICHAECFNLHRDVENYKKIQINICPFVTFKHEKDTRGPSAGAKEPGTKSMDLPLIVDSVFQTVRL